MSTVIRFPVRQAATVGQRYGRLVEHLLRGHHLFSREYHASVSAARRGEVAAVLHETVLALAVVGIKKACPCGCQERDR